MGGSGLVDLLVLFLYQRLTNTGTAEKCIIDLCCQNLTQTFIYSLLKCK